MAAIRKAEHDVAIIGAGIVGAAIARELSRYDLSVALIEKEADVGFATSKANSGIIHGGHHSAAGTLKGRLEWEGNQLWGPLAAELGLSFNRVGDLTLAFSAQDVAVLEGLRRQADERGIPGVEMWSPGELHDNEPRANVDAVAALYGPTSGVVNPYEACFGLVEHAVANNVDLVLNAPVTQITHGREGFELAVPSGPIRCRYVINAAGVGAAHVADMAGVRDFELIFRKGEEYLLDKRLRGLVKRIIFPCPTATSKGILVIPTFDGTLMVGPTADDVDDPDNTTTTAGGSERVFAAVQRLVPGISSRDCIAEFAGVRAASDTGDFIIGATEIPEFINVAGIQSPGLTAAPAIAAHVIAELRTQGLELILKETFARAKPPLVPVRSASRSEQAEMAASDPSFGRVVCRCELVTEGEIVHAIHRGGHTLDGLKFRTRAGMGRCQGGFCTWRVMHLLASELDEPLSALTKRGGGSWIVCDREEVP